MTRTPIDASIAIEQNGQRRQVAVGPRQTHQQPERLSPDALGNLGGKTNAELMTEARSIGLTDIPARRTELALQVLQHRSQTSGIAIGAGILDVHDKGYGFLRPPGGSGGDDDIYVPNGLIRKSGLRQGDFVAGPVRSQGERTRNRGNNPLLWPELINGRDAAFSQRRPRFEHLTSVYPDSQLTLETTPNRMNSSDHRHHRSDWQRTTCADRCTTQSREDGDPQGHCTRGCGKLPSDPYRCGIDR